MSAVERASAVRDVTDEEVGHFHEHGWVMLRNLISPELAAAIREGAKQRLGEEGEGSGPDVRKLDFYDSYMRPSLDGEPYQSVAWSPVLGRSTARLLGRDSGIKLLYDNVAVKRPPEKGGVPTDYHQDHSVFPFDRSGLTWWIALDEVTPERGSMRFFNGSHKLGPLGRGLHTAEGIVEEWPRLKDCPLSEPLTYQPGDATAHHDSVVHGGPENTTDRPRWSYILIVFPADSLFTIRHHTTQHIDFELFQPLEHPDFPVIYTPA